jgi:hypothetical protein
MTGVLVCGLLVVSDAAGAAGASRSAATSPQVLLVGTFNKHAGQYATVQAAVDAAQSGDWILVAPGDYHESDDTKVPASWVADGEYGGVLIATSGVHLRGMDRNTVIVDGTKPGSGTPCNSAQSDQNFLNGEGRNGIVVWKANDVSIDNLTVCNFLAGTGNAGNEIWWNGGAGSGKVGLKDYEGSYLTATSTYFANSDPNNASFCDICALYGIFSSNSAGGSWNELFANNFADSGAYIGACQQVCNATVENATFEDNALGYSGTNSGGQIVIEKSTFEDNKEGLDTNTALTGDPPPPQDGECPGNKATTTSVKIPGTSINSCWVFTGNTVEDNNNPNVPVEGTAGLGPTGTGMTISGGRYDTITDNEFLDNAAWGMLFVPYPDANLSSDGKTCAKTGGWDVTSVGIPGVSCLYDPEGDVSLNNKFSGNGTFGNKSNADYGNLLTGGHEPENCFSGNTEWNSTFTTGTGQATDADSGDGLPLLTPSTCGSLTPTSNPALEGPNTDVTLLFQAECDAGVLSGSNCSSANYPQATSVVIHPLPSLPSMPNPCTGVPTNAWCPNGKPVKATASVPSHHRSAHAAGGRVFSLDVAVFRSLAPRIRLAAS